MLLCNKGASIQAQLRVGFAGKVTCHAFKLVIQMAIDKL